MGATSHDVARAAGVSQSTVSRALRGEAGMSEQTRERIRAVAAELSYVPSEIGRSLSTRATRRIGVVAADLTNPFFPELVEPLREDLDRNGYRTLLITDHEQNPIEIGRLAGWRSSHHHAAWFLPARGTEHARHPVRHRQP